MRSNAVVNNRGFPVPAFHKPADRRQEKRVACDDDITIIVPTSLCESDSGSFIIVKGRILDRSDNGLRFTCVTKIENGIVQLQPYRDGIAESYVEGKIVSAHHDWGGRWEYGVLFRRQSAPTTA